MNTTYVLCSPLQPFFSLKVASTLVDLLFIELMSHLTCKANGPSINTSHTWTNIVYTNHNRKGTFLQRVQREESLLAPSFEHVTFRPRFFSNLQPYLPYRIQPHGRAPFKWPVLWGPLCSSRQQAVRNTVQTFPQPVSLERVCRTSAWLTALFISNGSKLWLRSA